MKLQTYLILLSAQYLQKNEAALLTTSNRAQCELMPQIKITANGIIGIINNMKLSSAAAIDNTTSKILKNAKELTTTILALLFMQSLYLAQIPIDWKIGKISPVFKSSSRASPLNYRPISLTSVPSKIMEHIIFTNIMNHLERNHYLHPSQPGFRKGLSCETQLAAFIHDLHVNLDNNTQTDAIFLDFEKAFDKVSHHHLMAKLVHLNLDRYVLSWISDFLTNRKQFVLVNSSSDTRPILSGVPQGTVLGPLFFFLYQRPPIQYRLQYSLICR